MIHVLLPLARPPHELVGLFHKEPAQPRELYSYLSVGSQLALSWLYSWLSVGSAVFPRFCHLHKNIQIYFIIKGGAGLPQSTI